MRREAAANWKLRHPGVVGLKAVCVTPNFEGLVLEYVEGGSLAQRIYNPEYALPKPKALRIFREVMIAVAFIHSQNCLHLDIKSDNVLMDGDKPKLTDLGTALEQRATLAFLTPAGECTLRWAAPERITGAASSLSPESDVYSAAMLLLEMLTRCRDWRCGGFVVANCSSQKGAGHSSGGRLSLRVPVAALLVSQSERVSQRGAGGRNGAANVARELLAVPSIRAVIRRRVLRPTGRAALLLQSVLGRCHDGDLQPEHNRELTEEGFVRCRCNGVISLQILGSLFSASHSALWQAWDAARIDKAMHSSDCDTRLRFKR